MSRSEHIRRVVKSTAINAASAVRDATGKFKKAAIDAVKGPAQQVLGRIRGR